MNPDAEWHVPSELHWRVWDGVALVFHADSGDTHLLNPLAAQVLRSLEARPSTADELAGRVAKELEVGPEEELRSQIDVVLSRFDELGLVEPVDDRERPARSGSA